MRDYGVVSPQFWIGETGKSLRGKVEAQLVALYLTTSPHANMIGVFYCPIDYIAKETGLPIEGASKGLQSLIEADFCRFDEATEEVFVVRMAAFQVGEQLEVKDNRCKGVARELEKVSSDKLRQGFRAHYSVAFHLPISASKAPAAPAPTQAPPKPLGSQEQDQEQEQDQDHSAKAAGDASAKKKSPEELAKAELWRAAVSLFTGQGMPEPQSRQFFGKLAKDYPDGSTVTDALRNCIAEQPADARGWLTAECQRLSGKRSKPGKHSGFEKLNYREGVNADGSLA